jgi:hypothetical protein
MSTLVTVVLGSVAITAALMAWICWLLVRGVRRQKARLAARVGRIVGPDTRRPTSATSVARPITRRQAVTVQAWLPGRSRAVAVVRRDVQRDLRASRRSVAVGLEAGRPVQPLAAIMGRLESSVAALDVDLAVIGAEPNGSRRRQLLAEQDPRIHTLRRAFEQVRRGVLLAGSVTSGPLLPVVVDDLNDEVIRLGLWAKAHHELHGP